MQYSLQYNPIYVSYFKGRIEVPTFKFVIKYKYQYKGLSL